MTMGERIRQARLDAGLSQRGLAGDVMTRNMLSALENDSANPSVSTLRYLSEKLCKPISYFLGEDVPQVPEAAQMREARRAFQTGEYQTCLDALDGLNSAEFEAERRLLGAVSNLELARQALEEDRVPYANALLQRSWEAGEGSLYFSSQVQRQWLTLAAKAASKPAQRAALAANISSDDEVLGLKAQVALEDGDPVRARRMLEAMEDRKSPRWNWLRGEAHFAEKDYAQAAKCYHRAEEAMPQETRGRLEICYREMEDYKMAYYYATKK